MKVKSRQRGKNSALIILDMLNTFDFPEAKLLLPFAEKAADRIAFLKEKLKKKKIPVIYVNDNFGQWQADWRKIFEACTSQGCLGAGIAHRLKPEEDDYFILKPKHSGFYSTTLELLLEDLGVGTLILTGVAGNICVLFTANDAHMRDYKLIVPTDCTASNTKADNAFMLKQLANVFKVPRKNALEVSRLKSL